MGVMSPLRPRVLAVGLRHLAAREGAGVGLRKEPRAGGLQPCTQDAAQVLGVVGLTGGSLGDGPRLRAGCFCPSG